MITSDKIAQIQSSYNGWKNNLTVAIKDRGHRKKLEGPGGNHLLPYYYSEWVIPQPDGKFYTPGGGSEATFQPTGLPLKVKGALKAKHKVVRGEGPLSPVVLLNGLDIPVVPVVGIVCLHKQLKVTHFSEDLLPRSVRIKALAFHYGELIRSGEGDLNHNRQMYRKYHSMYHYDLGDDGTVDLPYLADITETYRPFEEKIRHIDDTVDLDSTVTPQPCP